MFQTRNELLKMEEKYKIFSNGALRIKFKALEEAYEKFQLDFQTAKNSFKTEKNLLVQKIFYLEAESSIKNKVILQLKELLSSHPAWPVKRYFSSRSSNKRSIEGTYLTGCAWSCRSACSIDHNVYNWFDRNYS